MECLSNLDEKSQEKASLKIVEMNKNNNYTDKYLDFITFAQDFALVPSINDYNYYNTKSITITPSKIIYNIPDPIITNHFQRKLNKYNENIIKVHIVDEDYKNFSFYDINSSQRLALFIRSIFSNGINLGFCKYNYIGSSNHQLKSLGGWMINLEGIRILNDDKDNEINSILLKDKINYKKKFYSLQLFINCEEIINIFGDFSKEDNIFKNTSRKGMIFSDTKYIKNISIDNVKTLKDEINGKYIITDGIGKISKNLIELTAKDWGIKDINNNPISAIQIRFMGCKGVLAVDPFLENDSIYIRESQIKFNTDDTSLNVCSISNYKEASLNRQFIILLSSLGVKDEIFIAIQTNITKKYYTIFKNPNIALNYDNSVYNEFKNKISQFGPILDKFWKNNINLFNEPLFSQLLDVFAYSKLMKIKRTGKLNDKKCVCLMGVIDETHSLEQDEVYIHIINNSENQKIDIILEQKVIVYRSPSLYPGDIKILKAKKNFFLKHMVNVIVFSKKGKRPTFNKLSGGDLDGDRYFISFNEDIINNIIDINCKALEDLNILKKIF